MSEGKRVLKKKTSGERGSHQGAARLVVMNALLAAVVLLTLGVLAWFYSQRSVATVTVMGDPADLAIVGANDGELCLDMSPADIDATETDAGVTVCRLFGVKTRNKHWIEVAHTTNTDDFSFKIYRATQNGEGVYTYNSAAPIQGRYLNEGLTSGTASTSDAYFDGNFEAGDHAQVNAIPLYWEVDRAGLNPPDPGEEIAYYYLEATWSEDEKETDVIYIFVSDSVTQ